MSTHLVFTRRGAGLPNLSQLGSELQQTSTLQRYLWPCLPVLTVTTFCLSLGRVSYLVLALILLAHFIVSVTFTHDVVHGAAGFGARSNEWILYAMSLLLLQSAHAFRQAHLHHHSHCLEEDDFEGGPARMSLPAALAAGPLYLLRHWQHAFQLAKNVKQKRWMQLEAGSVLLLILLALALSDWSSRVLIYFACMWLGSWFYPLTTAWLPHFNPGAETLQQARTLRGRIIPMLLCNLSYHLEHHLYPQVPSYNLARLAKRLDPYFVQLGVRPVQVL